MINAALSDLAQNTQLKDIPAVLSQLAAIQGALAARLLITPVPAITEPIYEETLLTAEQVANKLGVSEKWVYAHAAKFPFTRKLGRKVLRFSESGLDRWISTKKGRM